MSHIYAEPKRKLLSYLQLHSLLSLGLFHLRQLSPSNMKDIVRGGLPKDGLVVVREVCDPTKAKNSHDEAQVHKSCGAPVLSWYKLQGPPDVQVIPPPPIPTLAFGKVYYNHKTNLAPPLEFLRFLKHLSKTQDALIVFYHYYTAYEDRLADSEYAWVFGKQDLVYIRHVDGPYKTARYKTGEKLQIIHSKRSDNQPILNVILRELGVTLSPPSYRPYFSYLNWDNYKI